MSAVGLEPWSDRINRLIKGCLTELKEKSVINPVGSTETQDSIDAHGRQAMPVVSSQDIIKDTTASGAVCSQIQTQIRSPLVNSSVATSNFVVKISDAAAAAAAVVAQAQAEKERVQVHNF